MLHFYACAYALRPVEEQLLEQLSGVVRAGNAVADGSGVRVDFVVVSALKALWVSTMTYFTFLVLDNMGDEEEATVKVRVRVFIYLAGCCAHGSVPQSHWGGRKRAPEMRNEVSLPKRAWIPRGERGEMRHDAERHPPCRQRSGSPPNPHPRHA